MTVRMHYGVYGILHIGSKCLRPWVITKWGIEVGRAESLDDAIEQIHRLDELPRARAEFLELLELRR